MSAILKAIVHAIVDIDGRAYQLGSSNVAREAEMSEEIASDRVFVIAADGQETIYDLAVDGAFDFLAIECDFPIRLNFFDATGVTEYFMLQVPGSNVAKTYGIPFLLPSSVASYDGGADDTIQVIKASNLDYDVDDRDDVRLHILTIK